MTSFSKGIGLELEAEQWVEAQAEGALAISRSRRAVLGWC